MFTMHCVIYRKPSVDNIGPLFGQKWIQVDIDLSYCIVGTVCVMVQYPKQEITN